MELRVSTNPDYILSLKGKNIEVQCPRCESWNLPELWRETISPCEDCGDHPAIECPDCEDRVDTIYTHELNGRPISKESSANQNI